MGALILVDLQVDFLSPKKDKTALIDPRQFTRLLPALLREFTTRRRPIIWVQSAYPPVPHGTFCPFPGPTPSPDLQNFEVYLTSTHTSSRFCVPGSSGAALFPSLAILKHPHHISIEKHWYSPFTDTSLHETLQSTGTKHLYVAGVTTNTCVAATAVHAQRLGYDVTILSDLVFAMKIETHEKALQTLTTAPYHVDLCTSEEVSSHLDRHNGEESKLPTLYYVNGSIPSWRVMLCLSLKNIPYIGKRLRVMTTPKQTRSEEFKSINPRCKTPTFVDTDWTVVIESLAILKYLEQYYPTPKLMPRTEEKAAWTRECVRVMESENPHNIYEPIELLYLLDWKEHIGEIVKGYRDILEELEFWEGYVKQDEFVSGKGFGMADCAFYPILAYMVHRGLELEKKGFPALHAYFERCGILQAVLEARPDGWEEPGKSLFVKCERLVEQEGRS